MELRLIDAVKDGCLDRTMKLYDAAFPENEKKPWQLMLDKRREGYYDIYAITDGRDFLGEALTVSYRDIVLLDYLAVSPEQRGNGIGTKTLGLLFEKYPDKRLILEIESTFADALNPAQRKSRKSFYLRAGMKALDYRVMLFGVEMELLIYGGDVSFDEYRSIFSGVYGESFAENVIRIS